MKICHGQSIPFCVLLAAVLCFRKAKECTDSDTCEICLGEV